MDQYCDGIPGLIGDIGRRSWSADILNTIAPEIAIIKYPILVFRTALGGLAHQPPPGDQTYYYYILYRSNIEWLL